VAVSRRGGEGKSGRGGGGHTRAIGDEISALEEEEPIRRGEEEGAGDRGGAGKEPIGLFARLHLVQHLGFERRVR